MTTRLSMLIALTMAVAGCGGASNSVIDLHAQTLPPASAGRFTVQVDPAELSRLLNGSLPLAATFHLPVPNSKQLQVALDGVPSCEPINGRRAFRGSETIGADGWYVKVVGGAGQAEILALGDHEAWVYTVANAEQGTLIARPLNQQPGVCYIDATLQARLKSLMTPSGVPQIRRWPASPRLFRFAVSTTYDFGYSFRDPAGVAATNVHLASAVFEKALNITLCPIVDPRAIETAPNQIYNDLTDQQKATRAHQLFTDLHLSFDLGQVFDTLGGGWGQPGGLCDKNLAGAGITNWQTKSDADRENIWLLTHEISHQLGAAHTFNGKYNGRSPESAVEFEGGRSLLGYPADHSELWFHPFTIAQILTHVSTVTGLAPGCGVSTGTLATAAPTMKDGTVQVPARTAIRIATVGTGATAFSAGEITAAGAPDATPPWFYGQGGASTPEFVFPSSNDSSPIDKTQLRFLTLGRDRAGSIAFGVQEVEVVGAGPFSVGPQQAWHSSTSGKLVWQTGGTQGPPLNAKWVDVLITNDPQQMTWRQLATHVPNTGSATVTLGATDRGDHVRVRLLVPGQAFLATSPEFQVP